MKAERLQQLPNLPDKIKPSEYTTPKMMAKKLKVDVQRIYQKIFGTETEEPSLTAYKKDGRICVIISK